MSELLAYLTVFVAAAIPWLEVLLVVPAGIVAGLPLVPTIVVAAVGNVLTVIPVVYAGDRLRGVVLRRRADAAERSGPDADPDASTTSGRSGRARRILVRYGVPGLAVIGPLLTGAHVAAAMAMAAGAPRRTVLGWMTLSILVWAAISGAVAVLGLEFLIDPEDLPDLGLR